VRFAVWICGKNFMKIPRMIVTTVITPYVSIRFSPLSPRLSKRVRIIQKKNAKMIGEVLPGIIFARDSPSPIR